MTIIWIAFLFFGDIKIIDIVINKKQPCMFQICTQDWATWYCEGLLTVLQWLTFEIGHSNSKWRIKGSQHLYEHIFNYYKAAVLSLDRH